MRSTGRLAQGLGLTSIAAAAVLSATTLGCTSQGLLAIMPGTINDPSNRTLRQELLAEGMSEMCEELMKRSVPLHLRDEDPGMGRIFPTSCQTRPLANGNLQLDFAGRGYAWTNVTKRMGFSASATVEYETDFQLDGSTMYVYFRHKGTPANKLDVIMTEQVAQNPLGSVLPGVANPQQLLAPLAAKLFQEELARGFTVVRDEDGYATFALGVLPLGQRPTAPFDREDGGREVLVNERIEVHQGQRDYIGPFLVEYEDMALFVTAGVEGAPAVDIVVVADAVGSQWTESAITKPGADAPPGTPVYEESLATGPLLRRAIRVPPGRIYLVVDNTATAGKTAPGGSVGDDRAALVNLGVELDDAP
jgi:hypothetical protein